MLFATILFGLTASASAATIPDSPKAIVPEGVSYTAITSEDIPVAYKVEDADQKNATAISGRDLDKRANAGVYVCTDAYWRGHCRHITSPSGVCVPLGEDLYKKISSAGPDQGSFCRFFFNTGCVDNNPPCQHFDLASPPGWTNLADSAYASHTCGVSPNDRVASYQCWA